MSAPYAPPPQSPYAPVSNYLVQAILVTIFCCQPLGIVAIVFAAQVNGKLAAGDFAGAMQSSKTAKTWCWVAFGAGLVAIAFGIGMMMLGVAGSVLSGQLSTSP